MYIYVILVIINKKPIKLCLIILRSFFNQNKLQCALFLSEVKRAENSLSSDAVITVISC